VQCFNEHQMRPDGVQSLTGHLLLLLSLCRRMHVCIEDLLADNELISLLQDLLLLSDRAKLADLPALAASS
jgi:hypothetical protein